MRPLALTNSTAFEPALKTLCVLRHPVAALLGAVGLHPDERTRRFEIIRRDMAHLHGDMLRDINVDRGRS